MVVVYRHCAAGSVATASPLISLLFDIGQGAGLAGASGVRPFLPPLLAGALARSDTGVDFEGTSYSFLESPAFLVAVLALAVAAYALERRRATAEARAGRDPLEPVLAALALTLGALLFAGSLEEGGREGVLGLLAGAACAALAFFAVAQLLGRARRRVEGTAATFLGVYADLAALVLAGLSILFPPVAFAGLAALAYLLVRSRGEGGRKYEGLRILR